MDVKLRETGGKTVWYTDLVSICESFQQVVHFPFGWLCATLRQKQRPASCHSKVTNLSPGCEPIKGQYLLGIYGGGSQPGQRAAAP